MLRHLLFAPARLIPAAVAVSAAGLIAATSLLMVHPPAVAQISVPIEFEEGNPIERLVKENTSAGGSVDAPVVATGGDGQLTYSLSGADAASFTIVAATGQILVGEDTSLDYESEKTEYSLVVTATGQPGQTASVDVAVIVEDVNEAPEFDISSISFEVKENTPANTNIGETITATDPEGDDVAYSLIGINAGLFDIDASSGQVKTKESLNFEARSAYEVMFTASEPDGQWQ